MVKTRTLPPLVRGKVTGVLDFSIDEIRIFRNISLLTENCDIVAQVQWWGEVLPIKIKPRQLHLPKIFKKCEFLKSYHSATYEIKTTLDLFKSYLETCEMLELVVYEAVHTCLIGSAFLKGLIFLVFENNEPIEIPLINFLGEEVGKIKIRVHFSAKSSTINKENQNIVNINTKNQSSPLKTNSNRKKYEVSQAIKTNIFFPNEKTIYASQESKKLSSFCKSFKIFEVTPKDFQTHQESSSFNKFNLMECNVAHRTRSKSSQKLAKSLKQHEIVFEEKGVVKSQNKTLNKRFSSKCFPKVRISDDTSKVLYFEIGLQKCQQHATKTFFKTEKNFQKNVKKPIKNISQLSTFKRNKHGEKNLNINSKNPIEFCQNIKKQKMGNQNFGELSNSLSDVIPLLKSKLSTNDNIPSKEFTTDKKTVDYLLGIELTKEDEERALNDFKRMSPCHDFVSSISQLCTISDSGLENFFGDEHSHGKVSSPTTYFEVNHLNFDFSNIIERNYFKKFFIMPNVSQDFEVAELLHKHENNLILEKWKSNNKIDSLKGLAQSAEVEKYDELLNSHKIKENNDLSVKIKKDYFRNNVDADATTRFCSNCNYNKKLGELDVIIESLKHFEKKKFLQEKIAGQGNSAEFCSDLEQKSFFDRKI